MDFFFKDADNQKTFTWSFLIDDINKTSVINPYCKSNDYYTIFKTIIFSLITDNEVILLDSDFSDEELLRMTGFYNFSEFDKIFEKTKFIPIIDKDDLLKIEPGLERMESYIVHIRNDRFIKKSNP